MDDQTNARKHALLSASSASRWLVCTAAPRFEATLPNKTSEYAEEGSLAHEVCELKTNQRFAAGLTPRAYSGKMSQLKKHKLYKPEMDKTSELYSDIIYKRIMQHEKAPFVGVEVKVDLGHIIPQGFGTCDCVIIGGTTLHIIDYKHGAGVKVSAESNPQTRLYALGALSMFAPFYTIDNVEMVIVQPRVDEDESSETLTVSELTEWGESVRAIAETAYSGKGEYISGEHCRFCRGKAVCKARAENNTALEDFKDFLLPTKENKILGVKDNILTIEQIGDFLKRGADIVKWYRDLEEFAMNALLSGENVPGWKLVHGRSNRSFVDIEQAIKTVNAAGYDEALLYERKPLALTKIEALTGKKQFAELLGDQIVKLPGAPKLALESDKREAFNAVGKDFEGLTDQQE